MRGRLLQVFLVALRRLDVAEVEAAIPAGGHDDVFREPKLEDPDTDGVGTAIRREMPEVRLRAQISDEAFEALRMFESGSSPDARMTFTVHMRDLERDGLVDAASGRPNIRPGDRVAAIYRRDGTLVLGIRDPPGLYVDAVTPEGWGLGGIAKLNLVAIRLSDRVSSAGRELR